jgi:hypothetical protein
LIQHQKAKHFKCDLCHKKLSTAGGLVVHIVQVHKETIKKIPNAKPERESTEYEIYGMAGIPEEVLAERMSKRSATGGGSSSAVGDPGQQALVYPPPLPPNAYGGFQGQQMLGLPPPAGGFMPGMMPPMPGMIPTMMPGQMPGQMPPMPPMPPPFQAAQHAQMPPRLPPGLAPVAGMGIPPPFVQQAPNPHSMPQPPVPANVAPPRPPFGMTMPAAPQQTLSGPDVVPGASHPQQSAAVGLAPSIPGLPPPPRIPQQLLSSKENSHVQSSPAPSTAEALQSSSTNVQKPSAAPGPAPGEIRMVWNDEEYSMDERRAQLPKYKVQLSY